MFRQVASLYTLLMWLSPALAWEVDTHYGLTLWLAIQAGANEEVAGAIARADQIADTGVLDAVHLMAHYACLGGSERTASMLVRDHHFPTFTLLPAKPSDRKVEAGGAAAWHLVNDHFKNPEASPGYGIEEFGIALHALQDSWSHQGVPQIPRKLGFRLCDQGLGWGHPESRHGWDKHDADLTWIWEDDTKEMAAATYNAIKKFLDIRSELRKQGPQEVGVVMNEIKTFLIGKTKAEKRVWFLNHGFKYVDFVSEISLDDGKLAFPQPSYPAALRGKVSSTEAPSGVPVEILSLLDGFFTDWVTSDHFDNTIERYFDVDFASDNMEFAATSRADKLRLLSQTLRFWRVRDHGKLTSELGHHSFIGAGGSSRLAKQIGDAQLTSYKSAIEAFWPVRGANAGRPYAAFRAANDGDRYVAVARLQHARYDTLIVSIEKRSAGYRIVGIESVVEH